MYASCLLLPERKRSKKNFKAHLLWRYSIIFAAGQRYCAFNQGTFCRAFRLIKETGAYYGVPVNEKGAENMKKLIAAALAVVCLLAAGCGAKEKGLTPLEELAEYTLEQAKADGCVVHENLDISSGQEVWDAFAAEAAAGRSANVRLCSYYTLDPERYTPEYYEREKDNYPKMYVQDLSFDGEKYTLRWVEEGQEYAREYEYLLRYEGEAESKTAEYSSYVRYVLTHDEAVTWDEITWGLLSSQSGAIIDAYDVYTDLIY